MKKITAILLATLVLAATHANAATSWSTKFGKTSPQDEVMIPQGEQIVLDYCEIEVRSLMVHGKLIVDSSLPCERARLTTEWMMVMGPTSEFRIGTEEKPFSKHFTLTLNGDSADTDSSGMGAKVLGVMAGGTLELHGSSRDKRSWTQLRETVLAGSATLLLVSPVNWTPGDKIVVAPTGVDPFEAEEREATSVSPDGLTLTLNVSSNIRTTEGQSPTTERCSTCERKLVSSRETS